MPESHAACNVALASASSTTSNRSPSPAPPKPSCVTSTFVRPSLRRTSGSIGKCPLARDPGAARPVFPGAGVARAGLPHLNDFAFAEVDDVTTHSHCLGLELRIDLQVNRGVHRVLNRGAGD